MLDIRDMYHPSYWLASIVTGLRNQTEPDECPNSKVQMYQSCKRNPQNTPSTKYLLPVAECLC